MSIDQGANIFGTKTLAGLVAGFGLKNNNAGRTGLDQLDIAVDGITTTISSQNKLTVIDTNQAGTGLTKTAGVLSVNAVQSQITQVGTLTGLSLTGAVVTNLLTANGGTEHFTLCNNLLVPRFKLGLGITETGAGDVGSDFNLWRYHDNGFFAGTIFTAKRSTGDITTGSTTDSTSSITGSLILPGGLGVAKQVWLGGGLNYSHPVGLSLNAGNGSSPNGGQLSFGDGTGWVFRIKKFTTAADVITFQDNGKITSFDTTQSTNTSSGGIIGLGGLGIAKKINCVGLDVGSQVISSVSNPVAASDAATKAYVDTIGSGIKVKTAVRVAGTANVTIASPGTTIDGTTLNSGDRVILKNQTTALQNGVYTFNGGGSPMTRTADVATGTAAAGFYFFTTAGSVNGGVSFIINNAVGSDVVDTNALIFVQFSQTSTLIFTGGVTNSGGTVTVDAAQPTVTSLGTLTSLNSAGTVTATNIVNNGTLTNNGTAQINGPLNSSNTVTAVNVHCTSNITIDNQLILQNNGVSNNGAWVNSVSYFGKVNTRNFSFPYQDNSQFLSQISGTGPLIWSNGLSYYAPSVSNGIFSLFQRGSYLVEIEYQWDAGSQDVRNLYMETKIVRRPDNFTFGRKVINVGDNQLVQHTATFIINGDTGSNFDVQLYLWTRGPSAIFQPLTNTVFLISISPMMLSVGF